MAKSSESNEFILELSKEQLGLALKALAPFRTDDNVRMSLVEDNIIFETEELGNTAKVSIGSTKISENMIGIQIFLSKSVLNKIYDNMEGIVSLNFLKKGDDWSELVANISGDKINVGLPIYTKDIDTSYKPTEKSEDISSETLANVIKRTEVSMVKDSPTLGSIDIGSDFVCGSSTCISKYKGFMNSGMEVRISPSFKPVLSHLTKLGEKITVIEAENNSIVFLCGSIEYKTYGVSHKIPNPEDQLSGSIVKFRAGLENIKKSCERLSIPLNGDSSLMISVENNTLNLKVFDIQGRMSESNLPLIGKEGDNCMVSVPMYAFQNIISVMNPEATISFEKQDEDDNIPVAVKIEDEKQLTVLAVNIIEE